MTIILQVPICDVRVFLKSTNALPLYLKFLPLIEDYHYIKFFGKVKKRQKGGHLFYKDELFYIDARNVIKLDFLENFETDIFCNADCLFRRLLISPEGLIRFELGIRFKIDKTISINNYQLLDIINLSKKILNQSIRIKNHSKEFSVIKLYELSRLIPKLFTNATQASDSQEIVYQKLVKSGKPILWIYNNDENQFKLPNKKITYKAKGLHKITLIQLKLHSKQIPLIFVNKPEKNIPEFRNIRVTYFRLHSEIQYLKLLLNLTNRNKYKYNTNKIQSVYKSKKITLFNESTDKESMISTLEVYRAFHSEELSYIYDFLDQSIEKVTLYNNRETYDNFKILIAQNKILDAIFLLKSKIKHTNQKNLILQEALYKELLTKNRNNLLRQDEYVLFRNKVVDAILDLGEQYLSSLS